MATQDEHAFEETLNAYVEEQTKEFSRASTPLRLALSGSIEATQQPYIVGLTNITGQDLNWQIFYGLVGNPNVEHTGRHPLPNNAQSGLQLGGPGDCNRVTAYRLLVDDGNAIVADTGNVVAHQNPATPCFDAYVIQ